jgi:hypothetical protein
MRDGECWEHDYCRKDVTFCNNFHRKWPTPEQYKEEYGEDYPDEGAVYIRNSGWGWQPETQREANARLKNVQKTQIVCACTPWGKPPDQPDETEKRGGTK